MPIPIAILALLATLQQPAQNPPPTPPATPPDLHADHPARPLFLANCAQCHGETGDGKGTTKLDRDARSFQLGGFSYGNTPEALVRTITYGIPGTPMPSFEKALKPEQRKQLAEYVLLLGPPAEKTDPKESVLLVRDKPLVVRGKLPPLVEGGPAFPRGLMIGTPEGLSFEYRVDDVRLLAVLSGDFVDRADWRGRGGDPLTPRGKAVHLIGEGKSGPFFCSTHHALKAQLIRTEARARSAVLTYELRNAGTGDPVALVRETPSAFSCELGAGYRRHMQIELLQPGVELGTPGFLGLALPLNGGEYDDPVAVTTIRSKKPTRTWMKNKDSQSLGQCWVILPAVEHDALHFDFDVFVLPGIEALKSDGADVQAIERALKEGGGR